MDAEVVWKGDLFFEAVNRGLTSGLDASPPEGDKAANPKEVVLNAMCGCSGMDVITIAQKMRIKIDNLKISAKAKKTSTIPSYFASVHLDYHMSGEMDVEKAIKAVVLSMTKYCGVSFMISKVCPITYKVHVNGKLVHHDQAKFDLEVIYE